MPRGKPKAKYGDLYPDSDWDPEERDGKQNKPQATDHKRGGKHKMKNPTNTPWDDLDLKEATAEAKARGLYKKDMHKEDMIHLIVKDDKKNADKAAKDKKQMEAKAKQLQQEAQESRNRRKLRQQQREAGEEVSSDDDDESSSKEDAPVDHGVGVGQIVHDDNDDIDGDSTTETTTTTSSVSVDSLARKLKIYEWEHESRPRSGPVIQSGPKNILYSVMKLVTTESSETLELPGGGLPDEVGPDFVPDLSEHTKDCARNGVLLSLLRNATIESAIEWATRTHIQEWNGRMFFELPPRNTKTDLQSVYAKYKKKAAARRERYKKERRAKYKKDGRIEKVDPKKRAQERQQEQRDKTRDVYMASEYRPPICYVPSYLEYPLLGDDDDVEVGRTMHNLFYIRYKNYQLPHYYFWADPDDWSDPTVPNPAWVQAEPSQSAKLPLAAKGHTGYQQLPKKAVPVKKTPAPPKFSASAKPPKGSKYKVALWTIEKDLYNHGIGSTVNKLRQRWLKEGRGPMWISLVSDLMRQFPGKFPTAPPVGPHEPHVTSLAEKLAALDVPRPLEEFESGSEYESESVEPISGNEPWTRDDAASWITIDAAEQKQEDDIQKELLRQQSTVALNRKTSSSGVFAWMNDIRSPQTPAAALSYAFLQRDSPSRRDAEREEWESRFMQHVAEETALASTIDSMPVAELKEHLINMTSERRQSTTNSPQDRCNVCLEPLNHLNYEEFLAHHETHAKSASEMCPFCGSPWGHLTSEMKATHIYIHNYEEGAARYNKRRSSTPSGMRALAAVPGPEERASARDKKKTADAEIRKVSKVHFAPNVVTRRIAYNDVEDDNHGTELRLSVAPTSDLCHPRNKVPRRSALRAQSRTDLGDYGISDSPDPSISITKRRSYVNYDEFDRRRISLDSLKHHRRRLSRSRSRESESNAEEPRMDALERRNSVAQRIFNEKEYAYSDEPSSASSYELATVYTRRAPDPSYRNTLPSPTSSQGNVAPVLSKGKRGTRSSPEDQSALSAPKRRKTRSTTQLPELDEEESRHTSTASNVSSASDVRRSSLVEWPEPEVAKSKSRKTKTFSTTTTKKMSKASKLTARPSPASKKRKAVTVIDDAEPGSRPIAKRRKTASNPPATLDRKTSPEPSVLSDDESLTADSESDVQTVISEVLTPTSQVPMGDLFDYGYNTAKDIQKYQKIQEKLAKHAADKRAEEEGSDEPKGSFFDDAGYAITKKDLMHARKYHERKAAKRAKRVRRMAREEEDESRRERGMKPIRFGTAKASSGPGPNNNSDDTLRVPKTRAASAQAVAVILAKRVATQKIATTNHRLTVAEAERFRRLGDQFAEIAKRHPEEFDHFARTVMLVGKADENGRDAAQTVRLKAALAHYSRLFPHLGLENVGAPSRNGKKNTKLNKKTETTILGRPLVKPLDVAPAKQYAQSSRRAVATSAAAAQPNASADKASRTLKPTKSTENNGRGRRSAAPTPSPSLAASADSGRRSSNLTSTSDVRLLVPRNTPVTPGPALDEASEEEDEVDADGRPVLDKDELRHKLSKFEGVQKNWEKTRTTVADAATGKKSKSKKGEAKKPEATKPTAKSPTTKTSKKSSPLTKPAGVVKSATKPPKATRKRKSEVEKLIEALHSPDKMGVEETAWRAVGRSLVKKAEAAAPKTVEPKTAPPKHAKIDPKTGKKIQLGRKTADKTHTTTKGTTAKKDAAPGKAAKSKKDAAPDKAAKHKKNAAPEKAVKPKKAATAEKAEEAAAPKKAMKAAASKKAEKAATAQAATAKAAQTVTTGTRKSSRLAAKK